VSVVLDTWAVMALVRDEPAASRVGRAIDEGRARMSSVNLGEVHYLVTRQVGARAAREQTTRLKAAVLVEDPDWELVRAAAEVKAIGGLSYADAFCIATARRHRLPLMTGDREIVDRAGDVEVVDLRRPGG
jgi:PIN domain nuclease of toxin-antitoxin system